MDPVSKLVTEKEGWLERMLLKMLGWMEATIRANQEKMEAGQEQMTTEPR
jgi:hypothetical protein